MKSKHNFFTVPWERLEAKLPKAYLERFLGPLYAAMHGAEAIRARDLGVFFAKFLRRAHTFFCEHRFVPMVASDDAQITLGKIPNEYAVPHSSLGLYSRVLIEGEPGAALVWEAQDRDGIDYTARLWVPAGLLDAPDVPAFAAAYRERFQAHDAALQRANLEVKVQAAQAELAALQAQVGRNGTKP